MGISNILNANKNKQRLDELENELRTLKSLMTPEHIEAKTIHDKISDLKKIFETTENDIRNQYQRKNALLVDLQNIENTISQKRSLIIELDEEITLQEFGLYTPLYPAMSSSDLKEMITMCRKRQKEMISQKMAATCPLNWTVDGNAAKGRKMINDAIRQILRSFNTECESIMDRVKFNNYSAVEERRDEIITSIITIDSIRVAEPNSRKTGCRKNRNRIHGRVNCYSVRSRL